MREQSDQQAERQGSWIEQVLRSRFYAFRELWLFLFFSAVDLLLTIHLLWEGGYAEANEVARFFLNRWGIKGLAFFKVTMVGVVCVIGQVIAIRRSRTARGLLTFAIVVMVGVVIYSSWLVAQTKL